MQNEAPAASAFEQVLIAVAVFAVVLAVVLWVLTEHSDEASQIWKKATGKAHQWLD